ncbi:TOBE domain-containing protein [Haloplanus sp. GCM10025708]|uniref:TOBE domain-containing protein n=1 Tax=Haloferacaceae TaxID=1644056 RepID=UPI0036071AA1
MTSPSPTGVELLRAIDERRSLNAAAEALGRSYSRAQQRVVELEGAFGDLVERRRGGSGGGGSELTDGARALLERYERLRAEFSGVTNVDETVLSGTVWGRDGELATMGTAAGLVRALVPEEGDKIRLTIRADAVTLHATDDAPSGDRTSARNRLEGHVTDVDRGEAVARISVDVGGATDVVALVTLDSVRNLALEPGTSVVVSFKATATRGVPVSS